MGCVYAARKPRSAAPRGKAASVYLVRVRVRVRVRVQVRLRLRVTLRLC